MRALAARAAIAEHGEARGADSIRGVEMIAAPAVVERAHPVHRGSILDSPQAMNDGAHARNLKRAPQAEHAFAGLDLADTGVTRGEHGPLDTIEIESRHFLGRQNPIVFIRADVRAPIDTGEREAAQHERIVDDGQRRLRRGAA